MSRVRLGACFVVAMIVVGSRGRPSVAGEDPRTAWRFLKELRERGLYEQSIDYLKLLGTDPSLSPRDRALIDYEEGRTLIDQASRSSDLVLRQELLEDARVKLDGFTKAHADFAEAREALVQMARLLVERGHLALLLSEDAKDAAKKESKLAEARSSFTEARDAYGRAIEPLTAAFKKYVGFIPENDPRRTERDSVHASLLDAMLQKGVAEYELGQTFPASSAERAKSIKDALAEFENLYKNYRTQNVGLAAQMWQAKCFEEQGDVGSAIGIYKTLLDHPDPRLHALQRFVGYFYIVALGKRKEYALAADQAANWLRIYSQRDERRSREGLGVLYELAKNIDLQMPTIGAKDRPKAVKEIVDSLSQVVRFASPYKNDALTLLKKYKPSLAMKAEEISRLTYADAIDHAEEAIASHEWERAIAVLRAAIGKAEALHDVDKVNFARYNLAFCYYMNRQYYEADVLAEHLARRYPQGGLSGKATAIAMQALADAYNTYHEVDRKSDIARLIDIAEYAAQTWPDREEGDDARMNLGQIYSGRGEYNKAIATLGAVRKRSSKWIESRNRLGVAHWAKSRELDRGGDATMAAKEGQMAVDLLRESLRARVDAKAPQTDPGLVGNVGDLAIVLTELGKPTEALALLAPVVKAQTQRTGASYARLMEASLTAHIAANQMDQAIVAMKALEQAGGASTKAQLYFKLGKLLEGELVKLHDKGDMAALARTRGSYKAFLMTLVGSKVGQTYESLQWAGDALLSLEEASEAEKVYHRVLEEFANNPTFMQQPNASRRLLHTKLKLASALRMNGKLDDATSLVDDLITQNKRFVEPIIEKGLILEAVAESSRKGDNTAWDKALAHWNRLARQVEGLKPRPPFYYDVWYHVAWVHYKRNDVLKARQTLMGVMRLSPTVGGSDMKAKYQDLLGRLRTS